MQNNRYVSKCHNSSSGSASQQNDNERIRNSSNVNNNFSTSNNNFNNQTSSSNTSGGAGSSRFTNNRTVVPRSGDWTTLRHHNNRRTRRRFFSNNNAERLISANNDNFNNAVVGAAQRRPMTSATNAAMEIDGFYFDADRNRYFRILDDHQLPGQCSSINPYAKTGLRLKSLEQNRQQLLLSSETHRTTLTSNGSNLRNAGQKSTKLIHFEREMGFVNNTRKLGRLLDESRVQQCPKQPTTVCPVLIDQPEVHFDQCQYLGVSPDGDTLLGCWSISQSPWGTKIMCLKVEQDAKKADEKSYGLKIQPTDNFIYTLDRNVVDICQARMDSSVTCVLYVTLPDVERGCRIFLQPVPELSDICDQEFLASPIYNAHWGMQEAAWSCAWEPRRMRVSLGLERCGMVVDMVAEKDFKLYTRQRNVLTQRFSKDGNLLFMGLRNNDILCCDLRLYHHHTIFTVNQTSTCWIGLMNDDNYLMAANFSGEVKLWDLRQKRVVQEYSGLKNSRTKTPIVLSTDETIAFATGEDGTTTCWSVKTGRILRTIPCPQPLTSGSIPKICYSNSWANRRGNAALVSCLRDSIYFYELLF